MRIKRKVLSCQGGEKLKKGIPQKGNKNRDHQNLLKKSHLNLDSFLIWIYTEQEQKSGFEWKELEEQES